MKFHVAWARVLTENQILKAVLLMLALLTSILSLSLARASLKKPVLIERGCGSRYLTPIDDKHTPQEIEAFIREAVRVRFDSDAIDFEPLLSSKEIKFREKEQRELKKKSLTQKVLINSVHTENKLYDIELDRVISSGAMRTALPLKVTLEIASKARTVSNPYGLVLRRVISTTEKGSKS